jgi:diguanylate cyclase (GGDEF)-like protein
MTLPAMSADMGFEAAVELVLDYLTTHVPLALWSVTRVENGRQTFLYLNEGNGYQKSRGDSHPWEDSFCIHMAAGRAPAVAPDAQAIPEYAAAGVNASTTIGAYAGAVIAEPDGQVFGAICGLDPQRRVDDEALAAAGPTLVLLGQLLTMVLAAERARDAAARALQESQLAAETDALTGLHNRRAWERLIAEEEERFRVLADPTALAVLDLDLLKAVNDAEGHAAGDRYIQAAAQALREAVSETDAVARLGGDEFGILLRHCTEVDAVTAVARVSAQLERSGVAGSLGWAPISVVRGFPAALAEADAAMYAAKQARRSGAAPD